MGKAAASVPGSQGQGRCVVRFPVWSRGVWSLKSGQAGGALPVSVSRLSPALPSWTDRRHSWRPTTGALLGQPLRYALPSPPAEAVSVQGEALAVARRFSSRPSCPVPCAQAQKNRQGRRSDKRILEFGLGKARMCLLAHLTANQMTPRYRSLGGLLHHLGRENTPLQSPQQWGLCRFSRT